MGVPRPYLAMQIPEEGGSNSKRPDNGQQGTTYCCQHSLQKWCSHGTRISHGEGNMHTPHSSPSPPPPPPSSIAAMRGWSRLSTPSSVGSCTPAASHASAGLAIQHSRSLSLDHPRERGGKKRKEREGRRERRGRKGDGGAVGWDVTNNATTDGRTWSNELVIC